MSLFVNQVTDEWGTSYSLTGLGYGALVVLTSSFVGMDWERSNAAIREA